MVSNINFVITPLSRRSLPTQITRSELLDQLITSLAERENFNHMLAPLLMQGSMSELELIQFQQLFKIMTGANASPNCHGKISDFLAFFCLQNSLDSLTSLPWATVCTDCLKMMPFMLGMAPLFGRDNLRLAFLQNRHNVTEMVLEADPSLFNIPTGIAPDLTLLQLVELRMFHYSDNQKDQELASLLRERGAIDKPFQTPEGGLR